MSGAPANARIALRKGFFCDGPYYLITSTDFGDVGFTAERIAESVQNEEGVREILEKGAALPIFFPGDCAFDHAIVALGDLTAQEEAEWIGRISWKLRIPSGKLLITCGGGDPNDLAGAAEGKGLSGYTDYFQIIDVDPGEYLAEIYAFVSSMTVDFHFDDPAALRAWFDETRPGMERPKWLESFIENEMAGELSDELVSYILRLGPLNTTPVPPRLVDEIGWLGEFEFRRPTLCPLGIQRSSLLQE